MADVVKDKQVAAVWIDPSILKGNTNQHAAKIAGQLMGMKPGEILVNIFRGVEEGLFIRRAGDDATYLYPSDHPNAKNLRHEWEDVKDREGKVRVGYLITDESETD